LTRGISAKESLAFVEADDQRPLLSGGIAFTVHEGRLASHNIRVD